MQQLRLALRVPKPDRVQAVYQRAAALGWVCEPRLTPSGRKERWHLPGTAWYVRANWEYTDLYRLEGLQAVERRRLRTDALGLVALALEEVALKAQEGTRGGGKEEEENGLRKKKDRKRGHALLGG